jgi:cyclic pyranopterin monophosphate synthase
VSAWPQETTAAGNLTHLNQHGHARMVDVTAKPPTRRLAVAKCAVMTTLEGSAALGQTQVGLDAMEAARVAGLFGGKQTSSLIPLCHPIRLDGISLELNVTGRRVEIVAACEIVDRTGVEMEALTACAVAGLSLVSWLFEFDLDASIEDLAVWHKSGGRSGEWQRRGPGVD